LTAHGILSTLHGDNVGVKHGKSAGVVHQTPAAVVGVVTNPTRGLCATLFVFCLYGDFRYRRRTGTFIPRLISFGKRTKTQCYDIIIFISMGRMLYTSTPTKLK